MKYIASGKPEKNVMHIDQQIKGTVVLLLFGPYTSNFKRTLAYNLPHFEVSLIQLSSLQVDPGLVVAAAVDNRLKDYTLDLQLSSNPVLLHEGTE